MGEYGCRPGRFGHRQFPLKVFTISGDQSQWFTEHAGKRYFLNVSMTAADQKSIIKMLSDRVLVQLPGAEGERTSRSGILIPATAQVAKRLTWAEAVAVGPLVRSVVAGNQVLFHREEAFEVEVRGEDYLILREREIHAVATETTEVEGAGLYL